MFHSLQAAAAHTWMEYLVRLLVSHLVLFDTPVDVANIDSLQLELLTAGLLLTNLASVTLVCRSKLSRD